MMQVFAAVSVSTGCLSFGICMAYTSSAIPSMMESSSAINITDSEASWMSESLGLCAFVSITDVACKRIYCWDVHSCQLMSSILFMFS